MTTQSPAITPVDAVAAKLLADVAFALRMARRISNEIRAERNVSEPKVVRLTEACHGVTLGA